MFPADSELAYRVEFFGDTVDRITRLDPLTGEIVADLLGRHLPNSHYVASPERMQRAVATIEAELGERLAELEAAGKLLEAQRLRMRTTYDLEMMREIGFCSGIENYSRHIDGRGPGDTPNAAGLLPRRLFAHRGVDESHVAVPQIGGMYEGDRSRKLTLVEHGFRLPSALDNRPLTFEEFRARTTQTLHVSATPGPFEKRVASTVVEQVIRPTGLVDPEVVVRPTKGQIDDLIAEIRGRADADQRVLVTTLTKKMSEDLTDYLLESACGCATCTPRSTRSSASRSCASCGWASTTRSSASTSCGRGSTCRRCRSSRSSTPTRRGSCARRRRWCRRSAALPATSTARSSCTPTR